MDKYIQAVLAADKKVIIPRFGCVIEPSEEPGTLSFNPYLNYEDGKLATAVSNGEGISDEEAARKIADYVDTLNNRLEDGETVTISGIGSFKKEDFRVEFTQVDDYAPADADTSLVMPNHVLDDETISATDTPSDTQPAHEAETQTEPEMTDDNQPADNNTTDSGASSTDYAAIAAYEAERKRKRTITAVVVIVLLLVIIFLLLFVFFKDNAVYKAFFGPKPAATEQVAPAKADTAKVATDTVAIVPEVPAAKKEKPAPTVARPLESRYNVIVGSYKEESTAIKRVEYLHEKGFTDAFVGIRKDYFVAVIKDFTSITQAEAYQEEIVDGPYHIESWITNSGENGR